MRGLLLWSLQIVKLLFSFCANAKYRDIACIVEHHYHVFHVPRRFYSVNKSLILFNYTWSQITCRKLSDPLTPPWGRLNWCQTWLRNTQGVWFSQLALCIPQSSAGIFTHNILEKYLGATLKLRYNGVAVYMVMCFSTCLITCIFEKCLLTNLLSLSFQLIQSYTESKQITLRLWLFNV